MFTLKILVGGVTRLVEPGVTWDRWKNLLPQLEFMIPDLRIDGRVVILAQPDEGNVTHLLGVWR